MGFFEKLKQSLTKTRQNLAEKLEKNFKKGEKIDDAFYDELEESLILCDVGARSSFEIVEELRKKIKQKRLKFKDEAKEELTTIIEEILKDSEVVEENEEEEKPTVVLVLGVNGVGKTTTIAKLCHFWKKQNKTSLIAAADTFRAAAIDQLEIWAEKVNCPIVKHQEGSDPAAVVFDSIVSAKKRKLDFVIADTAGRLHNKKNLMGELEKIGRIVEKEGSNLKKEVFLVLDATTGQNGLVQAKSFMEIINLTGIILTKLDGTAKGGIIIPIKRELLLPIRFVGTGEKLDDLEVFDSATYAKELFRTKEEKEQEEGNIEWKLL